MDAFLTCDRYMLIGVAEEVSNVRSWPERGVFECTKRLITFIYFTATGAATLPKCSEL
jgi:hypothetical protein